VVYDQHRRPWDGVFDKVSGDLTGQLWPKGWICPLIPHQKYLRTVPETPGRIVVDYDFWLADIRERRTEWMTEGRRYAENINMALLTDDAWMKDASILRLIGRPPMEEIYVLACKANSRWAIGRSQDVPPELKAFADALKVSKPKALAFSDATPLSDSEETDDEPELTDEELKARAAALMLQVERREAKQRSEQTPKKPAAKVGAL
jgi:hypothetical protein